MRKLAVLFCLSIICSCNWARAADEKPKPGAQVAAAFATAPDAKLQYWLYLPKEYDSQPTWPILVFLHGAGERGSNLDAVKVHGPPKLIAQGKQFPFIVVSPQCPTGRWWKVEDLAAMLDDIVKQYKVDQDRVYLTGLSMGGFGTWAWAAKTPERFAAIAPICGGGEVAWAEKIAKLPIWVFHGAKDTVVKPERSEVMVEALKKLGANVKYTVYPEAGHDSWSASYANQEFYDWLLKQRRPAAKP